MKKGGEYSIPLADGSATYHAMVDRVARESVFFKKGVVFRGSSVGWELDRGEVEFFDEEREVSRNDLGKLITEL